MRRCSSLLIKGFIVLFLLGLILLQRHLVSGRSEPGIGSNVFLPLVLEVSGGTPLPLIAFRKGPAVLFSGDNTRMEIVWQLDSSMTSILQWGLDSQYSQGRANVKEYGPDHQFSYTITGLTPDVRYYYRIAVDSGISTGSFFSAPNTTATKLKFFAYGDTRTDPLHTRSDRRSDHFQLHWRPGVSDLQPERWRLGL